MHRLVVLKFSEQLVLIVVFLSEFVSYHVIGSDKNLNPGYINGREVSTYLSLLLSEKIRTNIASTKKALSLAMTVNSSKA